MRVCILNSLTKEIDNIIILDTLENFAPYKENIELAPRHDGEFGWSWSEGIEDWVKPIEPEPTHEEKTQIIREKRQGLFRRHVDVMSGPRWESMTAEQKQVYKDYRQALLDITNQEGFPENVVWPEKPDV